MYFRHYLVALGLALAALSSPVKRDAGIIERDITSIDNLTKSFDASINGLPANDGTHDQGLAIHNAAVSLDSAFETATNDAGASIAFSEPDGNAILNQVKVLVPDIQEALNDLVQKKAAVAGVPGTSLTGTVQQDLQTLKDGSEAFIAAIASKTPADLVGAIQAQGAAIDKSFSDAIAAFSS